MSNSKKFNNVMLDLETLSLDLKARIIQISVVEFDLNTGKIGEVFNRNISLKDDYNFVMDPDTVGFWLELAETHYDDVFRKTTDLKKALVGLNGLIWYDTQIWCSENFDGPVLTNAYKEVNLEPRFDHKSFKGIRSVYHLAFGSYEKEHEYNLKHTDEYGKKHTAYSDCLFQIKKLVHSIKMIKGELS